MDIYKVEFLRGCSKEGQYEEEGTQYADQEDPLFKATGMMDSSPCRWCQDRINAVRRNV
jgi:hypothetical protein